MGNQNQTKNTESNETNETNASAAIPYVSEEMLRNAEAWTETDGDLAGVSAERAAGMKAMRYGSILCDTPRSALWHTPEGIDTFADIAYLPDGGYDKAAGQCRGHLLDVYLPHDAVLRGGKTLPAYVDIHGGGFTYGYKELNRNFNVHLADRGFAVFSLNYRPAPQTDLRGQLADVQAALRWVKAHLADYPVDPSAVFLTGDSAGGALTMLTLAIENNAEAAAAFGVDEPAGIGFAGAAPGGGTDSLACAGRVGGAGAGWAWTGWGRRMARTSTRWAGAMTGARYAATRAMARGPPRRTGAVRATTRTAPRLGESPPAPCKDAVMALARTRRAICGMYKKPIAKMSEGTELPNTTMKVAASAMPGKDMMMSRMRMMTLAMRGRTTAAIAPMMAPKTRAKPVTPRPMTTD